jgi:hypothetical protein
LHSNDGAAQLSEFLFTTKLGFCEHYAGAFATLMRAMGVPARVVVGFQGARLNELGGYWLVNKMDAHAWTEIWREEADPLQTEPRAKSVAANKKSAAHLPPRKYGRWVRFDPTEAVAPLRIQLGGDFNRLDGTVTAGLSGEELRQRLRGGLSGTFRQLEQVSDFIQMKWNSFLLGYDFDYQLELLANLGIKRLAGLVLSAIVIGGALLLGALMILMQRRRAKKEDPLIMEWRRFCAKFSRLGLERAAGATEIRQIDELYAALRYGGETQRKARLDFRQLIRAFSIKESSRSTAS